ncbi:Sec-independent protein translocase protein TatA [Planctomycetales bacterium 10988]|nr:Sec-independent protein translocase protein TatA [Planctomycetales bacterium 10988]
MFTPGPMEMLIIGVIAVLLFGKRLPEVGRSLGKGFWEFKRGLTGIQDEMDNASRPSAPARSQSYDSADDYDEVSVPKFEPPTSAPQENAAKV